MDGQFGNNAFSGTLSGLDYAMDRVEVLSLAENDLTGPLPNSFGDGNGGWTAAPFPSLRELHLYGNRLSSTVPPGLLSGGGGCCPNLTSLLLVGNEFTDELTPAGEEGKGSAPVHLYVLSGGLDGLASSTGLEGLAKLRLERVLAL